MDKIFISANSKIMLTPVLSILVISHNQRELLRRCMDSLLAQKICVPHEIVISDDRSSDGTWQLIQEYAATFTQMQQDGDYWIPQVVGCQCNSDECSPLNVSERCGWNKLNVYQHARGRYFVNIDADDYLKCDDIYQMQLEMLESHPECSMCMQDVWQINESRTLETGIRWPSYGKLQNGQILSQKDVITKYRALNQCYMIRRYPEVDCVTLYGKHFDDTIITQHHLQFGTCVYLDRADYVWVKYHTSITSTLKGDDELVSYSLLPLHHTKYLPMFIDIFMEDGLPQFIHMFKELANNDYCLSLTERSLQSIQHTQGRIYRLLERNTWCHRQQLHLLRVVLLLFKKLQCKNYKFLYQMMVGQ